MLGEALPPLPPEAAAISAVAGATSMEVKRRAPRLRDKAIFTLHPLEEKVRGH
jgi:hypothetical protein